MTDLSTVEVETKPCMVCGIESLVTVSRAGYFLWRDGAFVQDAFPDLPAPIREQLITGTHDECWRKIYSGELED